MTKRIFLCIWMTTLLFQLVFVGCHQAPDAQAASAGDKVFVQYTTYRTEIGWGYDILVNKKLFIHQAFIPAVQGHHGFDSEQHAGLVAKAILQKMKDGHKPFISVAELKQMGCVPASGFQ